MTETFCSMHPQRGFLQPGSPRALVQATCDRSHQQHSRAPRETRTDSNFDLFFPPQRSTCTHSLASRPPKYPLSGLFWQIALEGALRAQRTSLTRHRSGELNAPPKYDYADALLNVDVDELGKPSNFIIIHLTAISLMLRDSDNIIYIGILLIILSIIIYFFNISIG